MVNIFMQILDMSITASYVILAVMGVRLLLRKAPKKYAYAMWIAPLFRLLCPVSIQSVASAFNFSPMHRAASQTGGELQFIPRDVVIPQSNAEIPPVDTVITPVTPPVDTVISTVPPVMDTAGTAPMPSVTPEASVNPLQVLIFVGMIIWLIGMAVMVTVSVVNYFRLKKGLRFATRMEGNVWQCETVRSPFLVGLIKPKIYLPYGLDDKTQEYILAHERYHLKRFDHIAKLLGYAALTIHWFNPLCHLAFRLMNGDMEMSCDEYVLERNNIPTTQYSYSLLTIATNRRFPAATPLAFAETGVKERMINVLKWKKPKKWVSVVAVMVCVILLISCTTNPKVNDTTADELQVGNPAMLEFPGVKWFVTPDELKEALNITEEQILSEYIDTPENDEGWDYDTYYLDVADLVLFDREVTYAHFQFRRDPSYDFGFDTAMVMFAEDTDMQVLKEELIDIYGTGVGSEYEHYIYEKAEKHYFTAHNSKMEQTLEYMANAGYRYMDDLEGNPYKDALESPDHMHYEWVATTGGFLETYGITDLFKALMGEPYNADKTPLQDDAVLEEMLNQFPWISIAIGNHTATAITQSVTGQADDDAPRYTNNYMEFSAKFLSDYIHHDYIPAKGSDPAMLELPGMKWGDTPETIKSVLNLPEENYLLDAQLAQTRWLMVVGDFNFFGEEVAYGRFHYTRHLSTQDWALSSVELYYKEDSDMAAVKEELIELYGAPNEDLGFTRYRIRKGEIEEYVDPGFTSNFVDVDEPVFGWWQSETKRAGVLSEEIVDRMVASAIVDTSGVGTGLDPADPASRDVVLDYLNKESATLLHCSNNKVSKNVMLPQYTTPYAVYFDATTSIWAQSYFQLNQVGYNYVDDKTMLEFPRLKWGASVEEVKTALNIQEEQITTDMLSEGGNFDTHLLHVKDITFFGEEVSLGCFKFRSVDEENLGLSYVMLFLDEDTDMEHLQAELSYHYQNEGTGEYFTSYSLSTGSAIHVNVDPDELEYKLYEYKRCLDWAVDDDGKFRSSSIFADYKSKAVFEKINEPGLRTYNWVSPVKAAEVIDPEGLDAMKTLYERNLDIDPSLTDEWLEKRPLVHMSMANRSEQAIRAELEGVTEGELTLATNNIVVLDAQMLIELQYETQRLQKVLESE